MIQEKEEEKLKQQTLHNLLQQNQMGLSPKLISTPLFLSLPLTKNRKKYKRLMDVFLVNALKLSLELKLPTQSLHILERIEEDSLSFPSNVHFFSLCSPFLAPNSSLTIFLIIGSQHNEQSRLTTSHRNRRHADLILSRLDHCDSKLSSCFKSLCLFSLVSVFVL